MSGEDHINDLDKKLTPEYLLKRYKITLFQKIQAGETGLANELERIKRIEKSDRSKNLSLDDPLPEENGLPDDVKIKRSYTMSGEALEARRKNAQKSTGPVTTEGKASSRLNGWKHGKYASTFVTQFSKPCKTTCPQYPCDLIEEGKTRPGKECLDKEHFIEACNAIERAINHNACEDFNALATVELAQNMQIVRMLKEAIIQDGVTIKSEKIDKDGNVIGSEFKLHPGLLALPKLIADLGFTPAEFMITPRAIARGKADDKGIKSIADLMSAVGSTLAHKKNG